MKKGKIERGKKKEARVREREGEMWGATPQNAEQVAARVDYCSRNAALVTGGEGREESRGGNRR